MRVTTVANKTPSRPPLGVGEHMKVYADPHLTLRAKGAYGVISTFPPDQPINVEMIAERSREGVEVTRHAVQELKARGYLLLRRVRQSKGHMGGTIYILRPEGSASLPAQAKPVGHQSRHGNEGWAYAACSPGSSRVKIGKATNPTRRLNGLRTSSPDHLDFIWLAQGGAALERFLHERFADRKIRGEWFDFSGVDAVALIEQAAAEFGGIQ